MPARQTSHLLIHHGKLPFNDSFGKRNPGKQEKKIHVPIITILDISNQYSKTTDYLGFSSNVLIFQKFQDILQNDIELV